MSNPPKPVPQRQDPAFARVVRAFRIHPATAKAIHQRASATGKSQGQIVDEAIGVHRSAKGVNAIPARTDDLANPSTVASDPE